MPFLELDGVSVAYGQIEAVSDVSLAVGEKEIVVVLGNNGAGKTTTLRAVSGLNPPCRGRIVFDGREIQQMPSDRIVALGITHVPERRRVFRGMTVLENLELGGFSRRRDRAGLKASLDWILGLFPRLAERKSQLAGTLSGGEQQMLAMGRALMARPRLLMLDEPSLGLAPQFVQLIFKVLKEIAAQGTTVLLVEQNARLALNMADRGYVLETGSVKLSGAARELAGHDEVIKAYLGG
ncbi:MAG: ABC transporter ATP-binding protein [Peptococcaceae bacterium]|jgi:branched-chain amino acid transport system ATP-binding protein|nr:ABC transporter ATP-binding protein [Peptococcaceae bacterium]